MHLETPISVQLSLCLCLSINESISCHVYLHMLNGLTETPETVLERPAHSVPVFQEKTSGGCITSCFERIVPLKRIRVYLSNASCWLRSLCCWLIIKFLIRI